MTVGSDPVPLLPDPKLRARLEGTDVTDRAALAEALAGNMSVHIVYCMRADDPVRRPDPGAAEAVPVCREIDGETLVRALLAYKRGEPRVCAMVKPPTPGEHDRRHLCRERKALTAERVRHVNRIKGFLFSQGVSGYQPLRRDRRQRLEELQTGDGRAFPQHLKALVNRELDRLELLLKQIKTVEASRDALLAVE